MKFNFHKNHQLLFGFVFYGFVLLSIIIAIIPAINMNDIPPIEGSRPMNANELNGLNVYVSEGCLYCHTQQVRPLASDQVFGRPSAPGDYAYLKPLDDLRMTPAVLGSERTGPDLSNIGNRQPSETWHYIHLYNPRAVVKSSIMQAYPWLFEIKDDIDPDDYVVSIPPDVAPRNGVVVAKQDAKDLVAYLLYLRQTPIKAGNSVSSRGKGTVPKEFNQGEKLYNSSCASCHQQKGEGIPGAFPPLVNSSVVNSDNADEHIKIVLFGLKGKVINGVQYASEMPPLGGNLSDTEISQIINYERTSWGNKGKTISPDDVKRIREAGK